MKKHVNIPIFIPHMACPHQCSFCDQRRIAGTQRPPDPGEVYTIIQKAIRTVDPSRQTCEIAFCMIVYTSPCNSAAVCA